MEGSTLKWLYNLTAMAVIPFGLALGSTASAQESRDGWAVYVGADAGCLETTVDYANPGTPEQDIEGCMVGVNLTGEYTFSNGFMLGGTADGMWGNLEQTVDDGNEIDEWGVIDNVSTARILVGWQFGNFTPYLTGGIAYANLTQGESCPDPATAPFGFCRAANGYSPFYLEETQFTEGTVYGAGASVRIGDRWRLRGEVLQMSFDEETFVLGPAANGLNLPPIVADHEPFVIRGGVQFQLN